MIDISTYHPKTVIEGITIQSQENTQDQQTDSLDKLYFIAPKSIRKYSVKRIQFQKVWISILN